MRPCPGEILLEKFPSLPKVRTRREIDPFQFTFRKAHREVFRNSGDAGLYAVTISSDRRIIEEDIHRFEAGPSGEASRRQRESHSNGCSPSIKLRVLY